MLSMCVVCLLKPTPIPDKDDGKCDSRNFYAVRTHTGCLNRAIWFTYVLYNWFRMFARLCFARVRPHRVDQGCVLDCSLQLYSAWMCVASVQRPWCSPAVASLASSILAKSRCCIQAGSGLPWNLVTAQAWGGSWCGVQPLTEVQWPGATRRCATLLF